MRPLTATGAAAASGRTAPPTLTVKAPAGGTEAFVEVPVVGQGEGHAVGGQDGRAGAFGGDDTQSVATSSRLPSRS